MAQLVKKSTYNVGDLGSIPGLGSPLEKGKATHFSILAWRIPWTVQSIGSQRVGHNRATFTYFYYYYISSTSDHQALLDPGVRDPCSRGRSYRRVWIPGDRAHWGPPQRLPATGATHWVICVRACEINRGGCLQYTGVSGSRLFYLNHRSLPFTVLVRSIYWSLRCWQDQGTSMCLPLYFGVIHGSSPFLDKINQKISILTNL